ncbi:ABC transporter substrate-binding protein [Pseudoroseomonas ludipueritiae]|uniref:ABC transporter substrate-binding protein n=1 Tax=Pseudoroseomonas ludipueritiae TaxID=198093 RepID=A0ABR7R4F9_9PROT|nr:ABC transporter substrate-binding protein [Pseudoroseomonas ludipueritiae]MBC9176562.1 ABC transporter substrate-binding protein [Pseudoroseomonas ludipueritiae]MCG7362500.1 ABC transporter substrate-binding protein [Roseomonas sp. ACRSG]
MKNVNSPVSRRRLLQTGLGAGSLLLAGRPAHVQAQAQKPAEIKVGIATFLSGPSSVFGVPGRQAAELLFDELNAAGGIGGVKARPIFVDEGPGVDHFVGEFRRLVQSENVNIIFSAISSADCLACAPLADELKRPTLLWDCGTQRIFEDGKYDYAYRTGANATPEVLSALLYLLKTKPEFRSVAVVNQDYAWGRDSWDIFRTGLQTLKPGVRVAAELFPRFGATDFSSEITRLLALRPDVIFSTSWGGDLDTFIRQSADRKLFDRSTFVLPLAESSLERVGKALPAGHIIGARGDHWFLHPSPANPELLKNFTENYRKRFNNYPIYSCHHMAQAVFAMKAGYEKAMAAKGGQWPTDAELAAAFRGLTFPSLTSSITIRPDGQGLEDQLIGTTVQTDRYPFPVMTDMVVFPAASVTTPVGQKSLDWLKTLKPDMLDKMPQPVAFR